MKDYLSKRYSHYYIQSADGQWRETTREACYAVEDNPSADSSYKQRWFYDAESYSYIVRLPRTEEGEALYRLNAQFTQNEERYVARKFDCVHKGTGDCDNDCDNCQRKRFPRIIELDKPISYNSENDNEPQFFEIAVMDEYFADDEKNDNAEAVNSAVTQLSEEQQWLVKQIFYYGKTISEIAKAQRVSKAAISQRLKRIFKKLERILK